MHKLFLTIAAAWLWAFSAVAGPVTLVALGDSLVHGYGLPQDQGFVPQLQAALREQGQEVAVINAGVSGDTTAGGAARVAWTLSEDVDAMLVVLGGNDMLRGIDPATVRANLAQILDTAQAQGVPVLLIGMQAPGNYGPEYKQAFDAAYPELAAQYGALLHDNFFAAFEEVEPTPENLREVMQADGIHPNTAGVARIVQNVMPSVLALLARAAPD